jgi:hypothetical protein
VNREATADPQDKSAAVRSLVEKARTSTDPTTKLEILKDADLWNTEGLDLLRREAVQEVNRRLKARRSISSPLSEWVYLYQETCECGGTTNLQLAWYNHEPTLAQFVLVPGNGADVEPFLVARYPLLVYQYEQSSQRIETYRHPRYAPLYDVSLSSARRWCEEFGFRLPTSAEWLWVTSAGAKTEYPWGDSWNPRYVASPRTRIGDVPDEENYCNAFGLFGTVGYPYTWLVDGTTLMIYEGAPTPLPGFRPAFSIPSSPANAGGDPPCPT